MEGLWKSPQVDLRWIPVGRERSSSHVEEGSLRSRLGVGQEQSQVEESDSQVEGAITGGGER